MTQGKHFQMTFSKVLDVQRNKKLFRFMFLGNQKLNKKPFQRQETKLEQNGKVEKRSWKSMLLLYFISHVSYYVIPLASY